ncbi:MAG: nitrous oxide reductase accessory protein NosL [Chitinophagales bacterium]|nr:nitrous oxide reductase accessory protein NosL [Chitinophagales bacterium]
MKYPLLFLLPLLLFGCKPEMQPLEFGHDQCQHCRMTIADQRYGAELVTKKGKVYKYDAVECLANSLYKDKLVEQHEVFSLWVIDFSNPATLVDAEKSFYLQSPALPSPMGLFITAVSSKEKTEALQKEHGGEISDWKKISATVLKQTKPHK